ncbi:MAG: DUF4198 domain-containing protein, partial [Gemmatimonadaceae bacterium]
RVLNGTFSKSENSVARARLLDLSVVGPAGTTHPDTTAWSATGDTSVFTVTTGATGTYVVGASLRPSQITLKAKEFNEYLASDGIPDILAARRRSGELGKDASERYAKHVKALIQVGTERTPGFDTVLGYPAELIPLNNPYLSRPGGWMRVRAIVDGRPKANQLVVSGGRPSHGGRLPVRSVRTDADGIARIRITDRGQWYVKFIHMAPVTGDPALDYESKWATLTFQVR